MVNAMEKCAISLELQSDLFLAVHDLATEKQGTVTDIVEDLLAAHLSTKQSSSVQKPKKNENYLLDRQKGPMQGCQLAYPEMCFKKASC